MKEAEEAKAAEDAEMQASKERSTRSRKIYNYLYEFPGNFTTNLEAPENFYKLGSEFQHNMMIMS
ncbi:MAG: hypothetical protein CM15mP98_06750 [Paracoccaceae bacterium]|nr:MAG: hypothetical protein CM15mP98_06750 [Paracoccaceae bacterium]